MACLQIYSLPRTLLKRGFWQYVRVIETVKGYLWDYVGRARDISPPKALSPSMHLGAHQLRNNLASRLSEDFCK